MIDIKTAVAYTFIAGFAVFLCRGLPFFIFRPGRGRPKEKYPERDGRDFHKPPGAFLSLIEQAVPPVAMTVLAVNSIASPVWADIRAGIPVLAASALVLAAQFWKRNFLISILGGVLLYMILSRIPFA